MTLFPTDRELRSHPTRGTRLNSTYFCELSRDCGNQDPWRARGVWVASERKLSGRVGFGEGFPIYIREAVTRCRTT